MAMVFCADPDTRELPEGTYTLGDFASPGTLLSASYVNSYGPYFHCTLLEGSKVTVTRNGDTYDITMNLLLSDGRTADFTFSGEISGTPSFEGDNDIEVECPEIDLRFTAAAT